MKKIACLSALAAVLAFTAGTSEGNFYRNWRLRTERRSGPNEQNGRFQPEIPL